MGSLDGTLVSSRLGELTAQHTVRRVAAAFDAQTCAAFLSQPFASMRSPCHRLTRLACLATALYRCSPVAVHSRLPDLGLPVVFIGCLPIFHSRCKRNCVTHAKDCVHPTVPVCLSAIGSDRPFCCIHCVSTVRACVLGDARTAKCARTCRVCCAACTAGRTPADAARDRPRGEKAVTTSVATNRAPLVAIGYLALRLCAQLSRWPCNEPQCSAIKSLEYSVGRTALIAANAH